MTTGAALPAASSRSDSAGRRALPSGCYVMGLTPFDAAGELDEGALRAHVDWMVREGVGFWPASPATGEGVQLSDAELFRVLEVVVEESAGRLPVVAGGREFPTAADTIRFAREARTRGADAVQVYPPTLGHSSAPTVAMLERFYDEVLSAVDAPVVLSSNHMTGFEVPNPVLDGPVGHPGVIGLFKHHPDQHNVAECVSRFASRTTVLTMAQRSMFAAAVGATGELDNLQNIAPRLCRSLHDAVHGGDQRGASEAYRTITRLWSAVSRSVTQLSAPRVVVYKAILRVLGLAGGHPRAPYVDLDGDALRAVARLVDKTGLREIEGLA